MSASPDRRGVSRSLAIALFSGAHFLASVGSLVAPFLVPGGDVETRASESVLQVVLATIREILLFPLTLVVDRLPVGWFSGFTGYVLFVLNSLLWGAFLAFVFERFRKKPRT